MGLDINVVDESGDSLFHAYIGSYSYYSRFRHTLQEFIKGGKTAEDLAVEQNTAMLCELFPEDHEHLNRYVSQLKTGRVVPPHPRYRENKHNGTLQMLLDHSDCDGEFNSAQCKRIATMLRCFRVSYKEKYPGRLAETYQAFYDACITAGKDKKNKLIYH